MKNRTVPTLPADVLEAAVAAFGDALIHHYRERFVRSVPVTIETSLE
jgi:hypothetical protein